MLNAAALRLAAVETLCPTTATALDDGVTGAVTYPTLARHRVFDTRAPGLQDLDRSQAYTPVVALYTPEAGLRLRGEASDADDIMADAALDLVCELAMADSDSAEDLVGVMVETDPEARLVLEALVSQCLYALDRSAAGGLFRTLRARLLTAESVSFSLPQYGLRFQRITTRLSYEIRPERHGETGGLPEPMASLRAKLPEGSYAACKLDALARHFKPDRRTALDAVRIESGPVTHGYEAP